MRKTIILKALYWFYVLKVELIGWERKSKRQKCPAPFSLQLCPEARWAEQPRAGHRGQRNEEYQRAFTLELSY